MNVNVTISIENLQLHQNWNARVAHENAFTFLVSYIQSSVIESNHPEFLRSLHRHYCEYIDRMAVEEDLTLQHTTARTLSVKTVQHFGDKVKLEMSSKNREKEDALHMAASYSSSEEFKVFEAAYIIRSAILQLMQCSPDLPTSLTLEDFQRGQAEPSNILKKFLETLYSGSQKSYRGSEETGCIIITRYFICCHQRKGEAF